MNVPSPRSLPRRPRYVAPARAAQQKLDRWAAVTIVSALPGYGKTTAVAEWLRGRPDSVRGLWLAAPSSGAGRALGDQLAASLVGFGVGGQTAPGVRPPTEQLHPGLLLLDAVAASMPPGEQMVIVVDDADHAVGDPVLVGMVEVVARHETLHLVVCSRCRHPLEPLTISRVDSVRVHGGDLQLTEDEIADLAGQRGIVLSPARTAELERALGGWPAAVSQVLDQLSAAEGATTELPLASAEYYLREVVLPAFADQAALRQAFQFSLADRLTLRLVHDLCDPDDAEALFGLLDRLGVTERRYERDDVVLTVPSFLQQALRRAYADAHPEEARTMHRRLARWFLTHEGPGHALHALHHAVAGQDEEAIERAWTRHAATLAFDHTQRLVEILGTLPPEALTARPSMSIALETGRAVLGVDPDGSCSTGTPTAADRKAVALQTYVSTSRRFASSGLEHLSLHDVLYVGTGAMMALRIEGRFADATSYGKLLERQTASLLAAGADPGDRLPWFHLQRGLTRTLQAHHSAAAHHYQLAWQLRPQTSDQVGAHAAANLALTHAVTGESRLARFWLKRLETLGSAMGFESSIVDTSADLARGLLALDRLDHTACVTAMSTLENDAPLELWAFQACLAAQYGLHYEDPTATLTALDRARGVNHARRSDASAASVLLARSRADLLLAASQGERAYAVLADLEPERVPILAVPLARLRLLAGDPADARRIAASLVWSETIDPRSRLELIVLKAAAALGMDDAKASGELMRQALALYRQTGLLRPFATIERDDLDLLLDRAGQPLDAADLARIDARPTPFPPFLHLVRLTLREQQLLAALATTASRQQIADDLYVSVNTVRTQLATLYRKLGARTREEALAQAARFGLLAGATRRDTQPDPQVAS